ncbi:MAG: hypothetical protein PHT95_03360 [Candidatus Omnitrophica bacterium]|jgi:hypothetical protein|nr:hypothetical protein [Candidatus Omnitrophota bacterium]
MKEIRLKQLDLRNFKGMTFSFEPDCQDTDVFGANASGKTTLADAFSWLLFGKDSLGRSDFEIKNLDDAGNRESGLEHGVEGILSSDGIETVLKRVYHEVWTKKRGSAQSVLTGNTTDYWIDGVPAKENEYKSRIAELFGNEATVRLLTSPTTFPGLPWQQQRSLLLEVCGDITDAQVIATDETLAPLTDLLKRYTVSKAPLDDLKKVVTGRRTEINKQIDQLPVRIDEVRLGLPDVTGLDLNALVDRIAGLEATISDAQLRLSGIDNGGGIAQLSKELQEVKFDISQLENTYYLEGMKHVTQLNARINNITSNADMERRAVQGIKDEIVEKQTRITYLETRLEQLRGEWTEADEKAFNDTTENVCAACGRPLPADRVEEARTKALAAFNRDKAEQLLIIETKGKSFATELSKAKEQIEKLHADLRARPDEGENELAGLTTERDALKVKAEDYSQVPGRAELLAQKAMIEKQIETARAGLSQDKETVQKEIDDLMAQMDDLKEKADRFTRREQGEKRIEELKAEEKKLSREFEELEKQLYLIETFIKTKVSLLTDRINGLFEIVRFKLYDIQVNGGLAECCVATVNGVPYDSGLNSAARTQAGLDIIRTLQRHYGLSCPIWIDNRESCTAIPKMDCQVLSLFVSPEDKTLRVEKSSERKRVAA